MVWKAEIKGFTLGTTSPWMILKKTQSFPYLAWADVSMPCILGSISPSFTSQAETYLQPNWMGCWFFLFLWCKWWASKVKALIHGLTPVVYFRSGCFGLRPVLDALALRCPPPAGYWHWPSSSRHLWSKSRSFFPSFRLKGLSIPSRYPPVAFESSLCLRTSFQSPDCSSRGSSATGCVFLLVMQSATCMLVCPFCA